MALRCSMNKAIAGSLHLLFCCYFQNSFSAGTVVYTTGGPCFRVTIRIELLNYILFTLHGQFRCLSLTLHRTNPGIQYSAD